MAEFTITSPGGLSVDNVTGERIYYTGEDGKLRQSRITSVLTPEQITQANQQAGNATGAISLAQQTLKERYGIDIGTLSKVNPADMDTLAARTNGTGSNGLPMFGSLELSTALQLPQTQAVSQTFNQGINTADVVNPNAALQVPQGAGQTNPNQQFTTPSGAQVLAPGPNIAPPPSGTNPQEAIQATQQLQPGLAQPQQPQGQQSSYTGPSIVDYLASTGQPSDFASRAALAEQSGIKNYTGTAEQNTQLLNQLRGQQSSTQSIQTGLQSTPTPPAPPNPTVDTAVSESLNQYGITTSPIDLAQRFNLSPARTFQEVYGEIYDSLGLGELGSQIDKTNRELEDLRNKKDEEIRNINDNPWFSEGKRVSELRKIDNKYESKEGNLLGRLQLSQSTLDTARQDARFAATQALNAYNSERAFQFDQIEFLADQAEKARASQRELLAGGNITSQIVGGFEILTDGNGEIISTRSISGGSGSSSGSSGSNLTNRILDGFTSLDSLTPSQRNQAEEDLFNLGFQSSTAPDWFIPFIQQQKGQSLTPQALQKEWDSYKKSILNPTASVTTAGLPSFDDI